jgi:hypothetical protein
MTLRPCSTPVLRTSHPIPRARIGAGLVVAVLVGALTAQQHPAPTAFSKAQQRGVDFLLGKHEGGAFSHDGKPQLGVTGLALAAVLTKPVAARNEQENAFVAAATKYLLSKQNDDGSFGESIPNYQTSAVVFALARLGTEAVQAPMQKAREFLLKVQNTEASGSEPGDKDYGGFGYGPGLRGDNSNTQFAVEALRASGLAANHEAFVRAIAFLQRTQNLRSVNGFKTEVVDKETQQKFAVEPGDDGGACYFPGNSKFDFDVTTDGVRVPRSYGSMTYALLKTYALCGLGADDERMKAATTWIRKNWTLDRNPGATGGLPAKSEFQGLFYYYETMARALTVCGIDEVETIGTAPKKVAWRTELTEHLERIQRDDGSWLNEQNGRWWEDQPVLCTIYALLALADCSAKGAHGAAGTPGSPAK